MTELNANLLSGMPNSWINQDFLQVFDCEHIAFKKAVHMFELMCECVLPTTRPSCVYES